MEDRFLGSLIGLAVGDALGTTLEFRRPGSFSPISNMAGGGPFKLKAGEWTDDTSMALCIAESLIELKKFDPADQMKKFVLWRDNGHLSSTGTCFDIGNTVNKALNKFQETGDPYSGGSDKWSAGNGSIMRLTPMAMFMADKPMEAIRLCGESSKTTHKTRACVDACRYFGGLLVGALHGVEKQVLLSEVYKVWQQRWERLELHEKIEAIAAGSFKKDLNHNGTIKGTGYVVDSLEAALWAFYHSTSFKEGALLAVNLGDDADTTGAVYGQLAGAHYGIEGIPPEWLSKLAKYKTIEDFATRLYQIIKEQRNLLNRLKR